MSDHSEGGMLKPYSAGIDFRRQNLLICDLIDMSIRLFSLIFAIVVVYMQCSKLFKCLECAVLSMLLCTIKSHWISVGHNPTSDFFYVAKLKRLCSTRRKAKFTHSY